MLDPLLDASNLSTIDTLLANTTGYMSSFGIGTLAYLSDFLVYVCGLPSSIAFGLVVVCIIA